MISLCVSLVVATTLCAEPSGQIAFVQGSQQQDHRVCILDIETREVRPVGPGNCDGAPVWSPDGNSVAFSSYRENGLGIRIVRADGTEVTSPKHANPWNQFPRWAPDGKRLAYSAGIAPDEMIVVYDIESGVETVWGGGKKGMTRPVWLDNSAIIAIGIVAEEGKSSTDVFTVSPNDVTALKTSADSTANYVDWAVEASPKADLLAFETNDGGDREIFVFSFAYFRSLDISNHHAADWNPVWSPDSRWVAFESFRDGRRGIYRVEPELLLVKPIAVTQDSDNWHATWSPDGEWLAFVSTRTGDPEIFVSDARGTQAIQLTEHQGDDFAPAWRPSPKTEGTR